MKEQSRQSLLSACFVAGLPGILACGMVACETGKSEPNQAAGAGGTDGGSTVKGGNTAGGEGGAGASAAKGGSGADDGGAASKNGGSGGAADAGAGGAADAGSGGAADAGSGGADTTGGADGGGDGGEGGAETCDDFSCPELGTCGVQREGARCVRVCTLNEDYLMRTDDDVAQLAALRCEVVKGSIGAGGAELSSLRGLETLREVTGSVLVESGRGPLLDLDGLQGLETVGQYLKVDQCDNITSVELPALQSVGEFLFLSSLLSAESIRLPALKSTGGDLGIVQNPALTTVQLDALESVDELSIGSNGNLTTLNGLPAFMHTNRLSIVFNSKLPQCEVDAIAERVGDSCSLCSGNDKTAVCE